LQPVGIPATPAVRPAGRTHAFPPPRAPACDASHAAPRLRPPSQAPPHLRMS
jgi:hypothetical protein